MEDENLQESSAQLQGGNQNGLVGGGNGKTNDSSVLNYGNIRSNFSSSSSSSSTNNANENYNHHSDNGGMNMTIQQQQQQQQQLYSQLLTNHPSRSDTALLQTKPLDFHNQKRNEVLQQQEFLNYYTLRFKQGVASIFRQWMALQLAIEHSWGGGNIYEKAEYFLDDALALFTQRQTRSSSLIGKLELEEFLHDIMGTDFEVMADDGSIPEIAELMLTCYHQCMQGNESLVNDILQGEIDARDQNLRQKYLDESKLLSKQARIASGDADVDSDSEVEDGVNDDEMLKNRNAEGENEDEDEQEPDLMCVDDLNESTFHSMQTNTNNNANNTTNAAITNNSNSHMQNMHNTQNKNCTTNSATGASSVDNYSHLQPPSGKSVGVNMGITLGYFGRIWNDETDAPSPKKSNNPPKPKPKADEDGWFTVGGKR